MREVEFNKARITVKPWDREFCFVFRQLRYTLERAPKRVLMALKAITADIHVL